MTPAELLAKIEDLFLTRGGAQYSGEAVSQLEHALQAAWAAEQADVPDHLVAAALLHDVGHLLHGHGEDCAGRGIDDRHEELGRRFLTTAFGPAVTEPIRLHVAAKRFLCATDPEYTARLSDASVLSLRLQGGPMTHAEAAEFQAHPHAADALALRRWDEAAKTPELRTPSFDHFKPYLERCLARPA
ncbi:MAG: HD domain-containing protein [Gemmataceae bacterium]